MVTAMLTTMVTAMVTAMLTTMVTARVNVMVTAMVTAIPRQVVFDRARIIVLTKNRLSNTFKITQSPKN
jgi:hypothetical protein